MNAGGQETGRKRKNNRRRERVPEEHHKENTHECGYARVHELFRKNKSMNDEETVNEPNLSFVVDLIVTITVFGQHTAVG